MRISGVHLDFPFHDGQTDRFLRKLPEAYRFASGQPKRILRSVLARYLPPDIWSSPKHGFTFPLHEFLAADNGRVVRQYLTKEPWMSAAGLCANLVQDYANRFIAGDRRLTFRIWALVVLSAWLERQAHPN